MSIASKAGPIAVVAPASAPIDEQAFTRGMAALRSRGADLRLARDRPTPLGYLAGSDAERAIEFNAFLRDPSIQIIMCARGGFGTLRILDRIDYSAARTNRPLLVGYSDITALQSALLARSGVPSLSGPMVAVEWGAADGIDPETERLFWNALAGEPGEGLGLPAASPLTGHISGSAEGLLIGGNLAVFTKLIGTPYMPETSGGILFLEEIGESPYRVDGYLAQLRLAGILEELAGVVIGRFTETEPPPGRPSLMLEDVFDSYFGSLGCPVATNLAYGHVPKKTSVPIGVRARLTVDDGQATIELLESLSRER